MDSKYEPIRTGNAAIERVVESWNDPGMGKVQVEAIEPWLLVRRSGGGYTLFLSFVDDTAVLVDSRDATTRHVPEDMRPGGTSTEHVEMLKEVFDQPETGMYPLEDEGVFVLYADTEAGERFEVGLTDDTFGYSEIPEYAGGPQ